MLCSKVNALVKLHVLVHRYVISNHGAVIRGPKESNEFRPVLWTNPVPDNIVERVVQHAEKHDTAVMFYTHSGIICAGKFDFATQVTDGVLCFLFAQLEYSGLRVL